ncbi:serine/threonine-protein kinase Mec1p [[Candida] jaroonii]|uniref:Serine/threonine-protein kinase Mec1p n=1 Tax=[Candida] jaroonii TaxID=467808 RepID=A0ACA9Y8A5_9ASCO|nr:serine/threonine-protein kinase Mec1p [[Candida] jaroonii]
MIDINDDELRVFIDDINDNINGDDQDFEKVIKYLIYVLNFKISAGEEKLLYQLLDCIELVINKKRFLLNLELTDDFKTKIQSYYMEGDLGEYLIFNCLHNLKNFDNFSLKKFIISLINISISCLNDLNYKNRIIQKLQTTLKFMINQLLSNLSTINKDQLIITINYLAILNDGEISSKLTFNAFELEVLLKRGWFLLSSGSSIDGIILNNLKSLMILNLTDNIIIHKSTNFSSITLLVDWIISCLSQFNADTSNLLTNSITKSLLKILKFSLENEILINLLNLLNLDYHLNQELPPIILQSLKNFKLVDDQLRNESFLFSLPPYNNPEFDCFIEDITKILNDHDDSLDFLDFPISKFEDHDQWLDKIISLSTADDDTLHTIWSALGNFPCKQSGDFNKEVKDCTRCGSYPNVNNHYQLISSTRPFFDGDPLIRKYYYELVVPFKTSNTLLLCNYLLAVYKLFASYRPPLKSKEDKFLDNLLDIISTNSSRDVRMLVSRILPLYLISEKDQVLEATFSKIFSRLNSIQFDLSHKLYLAESTISSLMELAIICQGDWLNVLVLKFIDLLGETNEHHVNLVYSSILNIAKTKSITPYKLLIPFLPIVAVRLIKSNQILDKIVKLLGVNRQYLLNRTKDYTIPHLLDYYKYDYIQDISQACGKPKEKLIEDCLPRTLAILLVKNDKPKIDEKYITTILKNGDYRKNFKFDDLFDNNFGDITWNILLQITYDGEGNIKNQGQIFNSLEFTGKKSMNLNGSKISRKQIRNFHQLNYIEYLIEEHILEIIQKISECINQITTPYYEKVLSLKSIEFLIRYNIKATSSVLGQISSCLQSLIENSEFEFIAMNCLNLLVKNLEPSSLISLFDIIISLIFQKFNQLELRSRNLAVEIIKKLFVEIKSLDNNYILYYFSIPYLPTLINDYKLEANFKNLKVNSKISYFPEFTRRLKTLNKYVVKQALNDLINFTLSYQVTIQQDFAKESLSMESISSISNLVNTLLDTANKFRGDHNREEDNDIPKNCSKALSIIGALDPNKFNLKTIKNQITLIHYFNDYNENSIFLTDFLENILITSFWASNDPVKQMYYSYSMQQFLKVLKLDSKILQASESNEYYKVWNNFSDIAKSTLTPFFHSKFYAKSANYVAINYPIYKDGQNFDSWLYELTADLIKRPIDADSNLKNLFDAFVALVRYRDNEICHHLLKHLALFHILNDYSKDSNQDYAYNDILLEFKTILNTDINSMVSTDGIESLKSCYQTVFEVLDYFNQWHSSTTDYLIYKSEHLSKQARVQIRKNLHIIKKFIDSIPLELVAVKSSQCNSFERTIFYFEQWYRQDNNLIDNQDLIKDLGSGTSLHSIYANINDLDALDGVLKKFPISNSDPFIKLKSFQYDSNWVLAQETFQVLSEFNSVERTNYKTKLLNFLNDHASYDQVLNNLGNEISNGGQKIPLEWSMAGLQASLLSNLQELDKWLFITKSIGTPQDVFNIISLKIAEGIRNEIINDEGRLEEVFEDVYRIIGNSLSSSSSLSSRNAKLMLQLHSVFDLSKLYEVYTDSKDNGFNIVKLRLTNTDQSFESRWKVLSMHNVFNIQFNWQRKIAETLLECSQLARENEKFDIAISSILKSLLIGSDNAEFEYAQLLWAQGKQTDAIKKLELIKYELLNSAVTVDDSTKGKIQLKYAEWLDESNHSSSKTIVEEYTKSLDLVNNWDKPYYSLGKYYDKLRQSKELNDGIYEKNTIKLFLKSLALGASYIYEILPKLITIWLDFALISNHSRDANQNLEAIIKLIDQESKHIPAYVWYTSITQMLSRINHKHIPSYKLLCKIILKLLQLYPKHALWFVLSHTNSKDTVRKQRVGEILKKIDQPMLSNAEELFNILIDIAQFPLKKGTKRAYLSRDLKITKLNDAFDELVIPVRSNLEIRIPAHNHLKRESSAFPKTSLITFNGVDDKVNVFHSLQMPKQITVRGSDGKPYRLMIKKDDTRKDAKVVEFTTMVNRLLTLSNESRKRNLTIPNYSVVPLAENLGIIEFVTDVVTMKSIVNDERRRSGRAIEDSKIFAKLAAAQKICKTKTDNNLDSAKQDLVKLFEGILEENPPVLYKWFINQFSDPMSWYIGRNAYTRSAAVMSIVGFIIGLGDRHCENILFFKKSGSVLHIDFDCLFEKGLSLPTPEIVPFRLTENMVDAMGMNKYEGTFRKSCEVSLNILRENETSLMNILETLIYDPLLDWKDHGNPQHHLRKVRRKIRGLLEENEGVAMNIHGQVDILIQQATSNDNLCQMYGGWSPYI